MNSDIGTKLIRSIFNILHIKLSSRYEKLLVQIFKFGIVGVVATIIDFIFLYVFREFCCFSIIVANTLAFIISVIYNYWASLTFVFEVDDNKDKKRQFIIFIIFSVIGLLINNLLVYIIAEVLNIYYMLAKVVATLVVMVFNFITRKKFLE